MALTYWHTRERFSDGRDIGRDLFFRMDDAVVPDATLLTAWADQLLINTDDGALINARDCSHLEPATEAEYDAWHARRIV